jgi:quercetin dioxygenase-like cupin family protein
MNVSAKFASERGSDCAADLQGIARSFSQEGFFGPVRIFSTAECARIAAHFREQNVPAPADWEKGRAVTDRFLYDLAVHPDLLRLVTQLIGSNVVLWGADIIRRKPGAVHNWHTDIESSDPNGRFVSVWIGLENTDSNSALALIRRSHKYGQPIQQVAHSRGLNRGEAPAETILEWARERDPDAALDRLDMTDGDAVIFDGRLWHGSHNRRSEGVRSALLLQYATPEMPIRIPDPSQVNWPFRRLDRPLPPVILVNGSDHYAVNRLVPAPPKLGRPPALSTWIYPLCLALAEDTGRGWKPHKIFRGSTRILDHLQCHASVLSAGRCPHPPHRHPEEEILVVLDGEADIVLADDQGYANERVERLSPGAFSYYPPHQYHTIRNSGAAPVTYLMFKWRAETSGHPDRLDTSFFRYSHVDGDVPDGPKTHKSSAIVQQPTAYLGRLRVHVTDMKPGGGYEPHTDAYDVAILVLSGEVETLGQTVKPYGVVFFSAGESHGVRNVGDVPARYLVFEFRAPRPAKEKKEGKPASAAPPRSGSKLAPHAGKRPLISTRKLQRAVNRFFDRVRSSH